MTVARAPPAGLCTCAADTSDAYLKYMVNADFNKHKWTQSTPPAFDGKAGGGHRQLVVGSAWVCNAKKTTESSPRAGAESR